MNDDPFPASLFDDERIAVRPATVDEDLLRLARKLPPSIHLGTSSWSFPGWQGLVYAGIHAEAELAREGLSAYARHPLLRSVGIDRNFYQPLTRAQFAAYAKRVADEFRFVVKAPAAITDAVTRGERGQATADNPRFLDVELTRTQFVEPALLGLGRKAGPLVFQLSPLPRRLISDGAHALIDRIGAFLAALPREVAGIRPIYAIEVRNGELLTPRLVRTLAQSGGRLCLGLHAAMPEASRQAAALRAMDASEADGDDWQLRGPLIVRWNLHAGLRYDEAKSRYAPFSRIIDADLLSRGTLSHLARVAMRSSQPAFIIVNNKAEGCAPASCIELARTIVDH